MSEADRTTDLPDPLGIHILFTEVAIADHLKRLLDGIPRLRDEGI
jgi:hypothetical protein